MEKKFSCSAWLKKLFSPDKKEPQSELINWLTQKEDLDDVASFLRDITQKLWQMINPGSGLHPHFLEWREGEQWAEEFKALRLSLSDEKRLAIIKQLEDEEEHLLTSGEIFLDSDLGSIIGVREHLRKPTDNQTNKNN